MSSKSNLFFNFRCITKEKTILLLSWTTLHIAISKCIASWFYFFYFDFSLFTQYASVKVIYSWNFRCFPNGVAIFLLSWSTLYIAVWKCIMSLFYFLCFVLLRFTQNPSVKSHFLKFSCSGKGAVLLHLSWSTLYVAVSKCIVCWFYFIFVLVSHYSPKMLL